MRLNLFVTKDDIVNGIRGNSKNCAVARTVKRLFDTDNVSVYGEAIYVNGTKYNPTKDVQQFIIDFDNYKPVRPRFFAASK